MPKTTPTHHPIYNVRLSESTIRGIISTQFPNAKLLKIEHLPTGASYNNRIYFITFCHDDNIHREAALKVSGRFFGPAKIENEVAVLELIRRYCPDVPVPKVLAWSTDGVEVSCFKDYETSCRLGRIPSGTVDGSAGGNEDTRSKARGWILISKEPGRILNSEDDLVGQDESDLMKQLAGFFYNMRTNLPNDGNFGNLRLDPSDLTNPSSSQHKTEFTTSGVIICTTQPSKPLPTPLSYLTYRLQDALLTLENKDIYSSPKRSQTCALVRSFISSDLSSLPIFSSDVDQSPYFTHYDMSPRNTLVERDPDTHRLKITCLLDFEFAGFFPRYEEFTNNALCDDWPQNPYWIFLSELWRLSNNQSSPSQASSSPPYPSTISPQASDLASAQVEAETRSFLPEWPQALLLAKLIEQIAPWWLHEGGGVTGDELQRQLLDAAETVERTIAELRAYVPARRPGHR